jgi:hypothetical protein
MIKPVYSVLCLSVLLAISVSCDEAPATITENIPAPQKQIPAETVIAPKEELPAVARVKSIPMYPHKSRIQKREVVKDSLNEVKAQYTISDEVIDSLNRITPIYDNTIYNRLAVSYFSTLADSLHGRSYYADNSDGVMLSIMDVLTSRLNEGTDIVFLIDKTGSMDDDIAMVRNSLDIMMNYLSNFKNVKIGMAFYGDKNFHYDLWYNRTGLTSNIEDIRNFMNEYSTIGNPDVPESVNDAIVKTVEEMNWTKGNRRLMLVVGDAQSQLPPYSGYSQSQVIRKCDSMHVKFNLYPVIISSKQTMLEPVHKKPDFVTVYPNPANEYCHLKLRGNETIYYEIMDMTGKNLVKSNTSATDTDINITLNDLPSGSYLIQVYNQDLSNFYSKPLIIQH